jgi:hypothetical protein
LIKRILAFNTHKRPERVLSKVQLLPVLEVNIPAFKKRVALFLFAFFTIAIAPSA